MATLENKTVVVVGGSSGIGFAVALAALQARASEVIIASSNAARVGSAVERLQAHKLPGAVRGEVLDARDAAAVKNFAVRLGAIDHVVWTSGDMPPGSMGGGDAAQQAALMTVAFTVRFWGPFILAQNATFRPGGSLTLTSGIVDIKPPPKVVIPAGVCAAVEGLTKGLAVDLAPVRVNIVGPGPIDTELWEKMGAPAGVKEKMFEDMSTKLLIKRIGEPHEVAEAYIFLMKCGYITGQRINVDGGVALA